MSIAEQIKTKTDKPAAKPAKTEPKTEPKKVTIRNRVVDRDMVVINYELQCREHMSEEVVEEYHQLIKSGVEMPPLRVVDVDGDLHLVDGFTRFAAYTRAGKTRVNVAVSTGTLDDAVREACGANRTHGLRRTGADIKRAVALAEKTFQKISRKAIAELIGVSVNSVYIHSEAPKKETKPKKVEQPKKETAKATTEPKVEPVTVPKKSPPKAKADKPKKESEEVAEPDVVQSDACFDCGGNDWELTDGGRQCKTCKKPIEENAADIALSVLETLDKSKKLASKLKINTALGKLVREVEDAGLIEQLKPFLDAFAKALKEV